MRIQILSLCFSLSLASYAQRNTYNGKTLALKLPVIANASLGFNQVEAEVIANRKWTVNLGIGKSKKKEHSVQYVMLDQARWIDDAPLSQLTQYYDSETMPLVVAFQNTNNSTPVYASYNNYDTEANITVKSMLYFLSLRKYFGSLIPAPSGYYIELYSEAGKHVLEGEFLLPHITMPDVSFNDGFYLNDNKYKYIHSPTNRRINFKESSFRSRSYAFSFGYQGIIHSRLLLDFQMRFALTQYAPSDNLSSAVLPLIDRVDNKLPLPEPSGSGLSAGFLFTIKAGYVIF